MQVAGEFVARPCKFAVGDSASVQVKRRPRRRARGLGFELHVQQPRLGHLREGRVPGVEHPFALAGIDDLEIAGRDGAFRRDMRQQQSEAAHQVARRFGTEQVARELETTFQAVGRLLEVEGKVEFGGRMGDVERLDRHPAQPYGYGRSVLQDQHHLEQGRLGERALRREPLHQPLERYRVGSQGLKDDIALACQFLDERQLPGDAAAHDDGVDEAADEAFRLYT